MQPLNPFHFPNIIFYSSVRKEYAPEDYVREHVLCHVIRGELRFTEADKDTVATAGETFLFRRNLLVKCEKRPLPDGRSFRIVYFVLEKEFLLRYALKLGIKKTRPSAHHAASLAVQPKPSLKGLLQSVYPYFETGEPISPLMLEHKLEEAILALKEQDEELLYWLLDFSQQGKVDLGEFMQRNFMFNVPMTKFAELTGRSLSTFQRDFQRIFGTKASTWLLKRRLQAAYEAISLHNKMPVDIYLDLGFEDIAHFSRTFKQEFGINPSALHKRAG